VSAPSPANTTAKGRTAGRRAALSLALALLVLSGSATGARAAGPTFAIQPLGPETAKRYFVIPAHPGKTVDGQFRVLNTGNQPGTVKLYAVDATTGRTSGAVYRSRQQPRREVGAWTRLSRRTLSLGPGQGSVVDFKLTVPRRVRPGEHLGGIVAENTRLQRGRPVTRKGGRFGINVRTLAVTAVQLDLPGPRVAKLAVTGVHGGGAPGGKQAILVGLRNEGTIMLKPTLTLSLSGKRDLPSRRIKLDTVLPRTQIDFPVPVLHRALPPGRYEATVALADGHGQVARRKTSFEISSHQIKQVFGAKSPLAQESDRSLSHDLPWALAGLLGVSLAFTLARKRGQRSRVG
jgi:hypothetical protein